MRRCAVCFGPKHSQPAVPDWLADVRDHADKVCPAICLSILSVRQEMVPTEQDKQRALEAASKAAGEFIVATRSFDLRSFTRDRWLRLLRIVVENYDEALEQSRIDREELDDAIPL